MADPLIEPFLEMMQAERGAALNTLSSYRRDLTDAAAFLAHRKTSLEKAERGQIEAYIASLSKAGFSPRTVARRISSLRQFYHFLYSDEIRADDPASLLELPRQPRSLPKSLESGEITALLAAARAEGDLRMTALLELLYASGLRVSELVTLPRAAIRKQAGSSCIIVRGKGGKERMVPLHDTALDAISAYLAPRKDASVWLFPSSGKEGHLTRQRFGQLLKSLALKAGLDPTKLSPHTLRHSFASHLLAGGADLRVIQELLGHSDISTTQIYTHVEREKLMKLVTQHHPLAKKGKKESG